MKMFLEYFERKPLGLAANEGDQDLMAAFLLGTFFLLCCI